jgi:hypothetical protein
VLDDFKAFGRNAGSVFTLGTFSSPTLTLAEKLPTGGKSGSLEYVQEVVVLQRGAAGCIYFADGETADVAAFTYPGFAKVGHYKVPGINNAGPARGLPPAAISCSPAITTKTTQIISRLGTSRVAAVWF